MLYWLERTHLWKNIYLALPLKYYIMEYSSINIFKFKISTDSLFLGGAKNKRLLEAIQNYHYLVQAYENIAKFNTDEDKSNFYYSFLNIIKRNNAIGDDVLPSEGDYSDASQRSKRDATDINSEKSLTNRSERFPSEGSVTKRRRMMKE